MDSLHERDKKIFSKPERHVFVCVNRRRSGHPRGSCADKGAEAILDKFLDMVDSRKLHNRVCVSSMDCLGKHCVFDPCPIGPVLIVYPDGVWYKEVRLDDVERIINQHIDRGETVGDLEIESRLFLGIAGKDSCSKTVLPSVGCEPGNIGYANGNRAKVGDYLQILKERAWSEIEKAPLGVVFADMDMRVQYMNPASLRILAPVYSRWKLEDLIGVSIFSFHKKPETIRKILENPRNLPYSIHLQIGSESVELTVISAQDDGPVEAGYFAVFNRVWRENAAP